MTLHPDLQDCYIGFDHPSAVRGDRIPGIYHPLIHTVFVPEDMFEYINASYEVRKELSEQYFEDEKYDQYLFLIEKPYRLGRLLELREDGLLKDERFWEMFVSIYTEIENCHQYSDEIYDLLWEDVNIPPHISNVNELPDEDIITIYRGIQNQRNEFGYSFSLNKDKAIWFAKRFHCNDDIQELITAKIHKSDVVFYSNNRDEEEVVIKSQAKFLQYNKEEL